MTERELWEELVGCGGWAMLTQRVLAYWQEQLTPHLAAAANEKKPFFISIDILPKIFRGA